MPRVADREAEHRILDAATKLFYAQGIRAVGMSQIISAAGCGKNFVYSRFPSKTELVAAYLSRFLAARERWAATAVAEAGDDPRAQVLALTREVIARTRDAGYRGCAARNYLIEFAGATDEPARIARAYLRRTRRDLRRRVAAVGVTDPVRVAEQIWLIHEGIYASAASLGPRRAAGLDGTDLVERLLSPDGPGAG